MSTTLWLRTAGGEVRHIAEGVWAQTFDYRIRSMCGSVRANLADDGEMYTVNGRHVEHSMNSDVWDEPICVGCCDIALDRASVLMEEMQRTGAGQARWKANNEGVTLTPRRIHRR